MKKGLLIAGGALASILFAGCAGVSTNNGMPAPLAGAIVTDMSAGGMVQAVTGKYDVVKRNVTAEATATSYFTAIAMGDISYATLRSAALAQAEGADELVNVKIDYKQDNVIGINTVTLKLTADAVKMAK